MVYLELKLFDAFWNITVQCNQCSESVILSLSYSVTEVSQNMIFLLIYIYNQCQNSSENETLKIKLSGSSEIMLF